MKNVDTGWSLYGKRLLIELPDSYKEGSYNMSLQVLNEQMEKLKKKPDADTWGMITKEKRNA